MPGLHAAVVVLVATSTAAGTREDRSTAVTSNDHHHQDNTNSYKGNYDTDTKSVGDDHHEDNTNRDGKRGGSSGDSVLLQGNSGVALASALGWYLKYYCHVEISWYEHPERKHAFCYLPHAYSSHGYITLF